MASVYGAKARIEIRAFFVGDWHDAVAGDRRCNNFDSNGILRDKRAAGEVVANPRAPRWSEFKVVPDGHGGSPCKTELALGIRP